MLEVCLRALDRSLALRARLDVEGDTFTTKTTGAVHASPLVRLEAAERAAFVRLATALGLHWSPYADGSS
jgi:hypothetical protein